MTDHNTGMVYFVEHYSAYVIAALGVMWAMTVWAFRSVIGRYNFATVDQVKDEIMQCKSEVDKRDDQLDDELKFLKGEITRNRELNSTEHDAIRDLIIKYLDK